MEARNARWHCYESIARRGCEKSVNFLAGWIMPPWRSGFAGRKRRIRRG
jgi:hypothetical protein